MLQSLLEKVQQAPVMPGVYLLKDKNNRIIYVGKANSLRQRLRSYLGDSDTLSPRLRSLQGRLADIDYVVTDNEVEALILECNLIKEYRPHYNVNLKDDKDYPYLILTPELYPRLELMRLSQKKGRRGRHTPVPGREEKRFGPFTDVGSVRETIRFTGAVFPLRRCRKPLDGSPFPERPCLNYQMGRCLAPCQGEKIVSLNEYDRLVKQVVLFLQGRYGELEGRLKIQMEEAAEKQKFEQAALLRDRLHSLQRMVGQQQKMALNSDEMDRDLLALGRRGSQAAVHLFRVRGGKLVSQDHFPLSGADEVGNNEVIASFIKSYYSRAESIPLQVVVSDETADAELLERWLKTRAGRKVTLRFPRRGFLKKMVELARRNCLLRLEEEETLRMTRTEKPLEELGQLVGLNHSPSRIESYDISHLRGSEPVGAMVVFNSGQAAKQDYRLFNIRNALPGDDYSALQEVLTRRAGRREWKYPDLIIIDGGRGQLSAAESALDGTGLAGVPVAALAKNPDHLFVQGTSLPVRLAANSAVLQLLQRIRDEVHRFAVTGHRARRGQSGKRSQLEAIPGIGPAKRVALLRHFESVLKIKEAPVDSLAEVPGISQQLAEEIHRFFHDDLQEDTLPPGGGKPPRKGRGEG